MELLHQGDNLKIEKIQYPVLKNMCVKGKDLKRVYKGRYNI